jgi:hypothetical protein
VLPRNAQCCCVQRRNVITHMLPCHAMHNTILHEGQQEIVLQVQCDMFLQWLWRILKQLLWGLHGWRLGRHIFSPIHRFPGSGMWCAVVWCLDLRAVWRVQCPVSSPSSAVWPGEEQSRETSIVEACAEELARCTTGREKEWLWMRSGRKKQAGGL